MIEIVLSVLAALGGGAVIIAGFAHWLGKLWASRLIQNEKAKLDLEIEAHKIRLKKSEFIFEKEYQATSELVAFTNNIYPMHSYPETEWYEVCEYVAGQFTTIEGEMNRYLAKHGAILSEDVSNLISEVINIAGTGKFEVMDQDIPAESANSAGTLIEKLKSAEKKLKELVHGQIST